MTLDQLINAECFTDDDSLSLFLNAAIRTLSHATSAQKQIIMRDLAEQLGCEPEALSFLAQRAENHEQSANDVADLCLPEYRDMLQAAE